MRNYIYVVLTATILLACGDNETTAPVLEIDSIEEVGMADRIKKAQSVFSTIPSPLETASLFHDSGIEYHEGITNPIGNVNNYVTRIPQALNFGVYGADLCFANIFNHTQASMLYMNCAKILAEELGIDAAFDEETISRMEGSRNNRDSLMVLINDALWISDAHMKENGQDHLAVLIIAGGWIEGLYLGSTSLNKDQPNEILMQRIVDQKYSLNSLIDLLNTYDDEGVVAIAKKLMDLQLVYNKIVVTAGETMVSESNGVATIGGGNVLRVDAETVFEIATTIQKIRNEIIS
jgi:hypothetical protein